MTTRPTCLFLLEDLRSIKLPVERGQDWLFRDLAAQLYKLGQAMGAEWELFEELCRPREKEKAS